MFNQERGAGEGKAATACPNLHALSKRLAGRVKRPLRLCVSTRTRVGMEWKHGGSSRGGPQLPALAFGFGKCSRLTRLTWKKKGRKEQVNAKRQRRPGSPAQARRSTRGSSPAVTAQLLCPAKVVFGTSPPPRLVSEILRLFGGPALCDFATILEDRHSTPVVSQGSLRYAHTTSSCNQRRF